MVIKTIHDHGPWRIDLEQIDRKPNTETYQVIWRSNANNSNLAYVEVDILPNAHHTPSFTAMKGLVDPWTTVNQLYYCRVAIDAIADHLNAGHP
jgi:hypothetical protein